MSYKLQQNFYKNKIYNTYNNDKMNQHKILFNFFSVNYLVDNKIERQIRCIKNLNFFVKSKKF